LTRNAKAEPKVG